MGVKKIKDIQNSGQQKQRKTKTGENQLVGKHNGENQNRENQNRGKPKQGKTKIGENQNRGKPK